MRAGISAYKGINNKKVGNTMDEKMIALLYLISLGVFFIFLVVATIAVIASSIKKKKKAKKAKKAKASHDYEDEEDEGFVGGYEKLDRKASINAINQENSDDIFQEAIMEANQIANETANEVATAKAVVVPDMAPVEKPEAVSNVVVPDLKAVQPSTVEAVVPDIVAVQPSTVEAVVPEIALVQPSTIEAVVPEITPVQPSTVEAVVPEITPIQPSTIEAVIPDIPVPEITPATQIVPEIPVGEDSAFADSAFSDSAFAEDSAFADSAFADSAFTDSAFGNNPDGNAFPGSAFENPTLVDPSAMTAATVNYTHGGQGQDPVGNFYWYNKEDVADRPDYKPEEMYYRHFTTASECIEDLLIEMYDCALVRTEDIRYIAYGIEPRHVAMRDVAATGNAAYNAAKKRKEPTKEDLDKIYRKWCSYVDKLFDIVEFRADNTTIGIIRDKLYEFGKSDVDTIIEGK